MRHYLTLATSKCCCVAVMLWCCVVHSYGIGWLLYPTFVDAIPEKVDYFLYSLTFAAPKFGVLFVLHYLCSVFHRYSVLMDIVFWCVFFSFPFCSWEQKENPFRNFLFFIALHVNVGRIFLLCFFGCLLTWHSGTVPMCYPCATSKISCLFSF